MQTIYPNVDMQLILLRWDYRTLSVKSGISYTSLRRKMRGTHGLYLKEAKAIRDAIQTGFGPGKRISLDKLFLDLEQIAIQDPTVPYDKKQNGQERRERK